MKNEQLWTLIHELLRAQVPAEAWAKLDEQEQLLRERFEKAAEAREDEIKRPVLRLKRVGMIRGSGETGGKGEQPVQFRQPDSPDPELDLPIPPPAPTDSPDPGLDLPIPPPALPAPPPECGCKLIAIIHPSDMKDDSEGGWKMRQRRRKISGGNVHTDVWVPHDTYDWTAVGFTDLMLRHATPCPDCVNRAVFYFSARSTVEAEADTISVLGIQGVSAEALAVTSVSKDLDYRTQAAVVPQTRVDSNLELEIEIPLTNGGRLKIKFRPELTRDSHSHAQDDAGDYKRKVGDQADIRVWARAEAGASGGLTTHAIAWATAKTLLAWVAFCDCPRHHGVRRMLTGSDGLDDADGRRAEDVLMQLAKAENSLFTGAPPTRTDDEPPDEDVGILGLHRADCVIAVTIAGLAVERNADRAADFTWRMGFETTVLTTGEDFSRELTASSDGQGTMTPSDGVMLEPYIIERGCGELTRLLVKIAVHGTRRVPGQEPERHYGYLGNIRLQFRCGRQLEDPQDRQRRVEITCGPFSIRAIVSVGDECQ